MNTMLYNFSSSYKNRRVQIRRRIRLHIAFNMVLVFMLVAALSNAVQSHQLSVSAKALCVEMTQVQQERENLVNAHYARLDTITAKA